MSKFKKGDRVALVKSGEKGVVDEVYGDEWYAVQRDGAKYPDKVQGFQIKAANAACNPSNPSNPVVANAIYAKAARNAYTDDAGALHKEYKQRALAAVNDIYRYGTAKLQELDLEAARLVEIVRKHGHPKETEAILHKQDKLEKLLDESRNAAQRVVGL